MRIRAYGIQGVETTISNSAGIIVLVQCTVVCYDDLRLTIHIKIYINVFFNEIKYTILSTALVFMYILHYLFEFLLLAIKINSIFTIVLYCIYIPAT